VFRFFDLRTQASGRVWQTLSNLRWILAASNCRQSGYCSLRGIVLAHAFDDGNKRTGWMTLIYFLACHRQTLRGISDAEGEEVVVSLVTHNLLLADCAGWIAQHLVPLTE